MSDAMKIFDRSAVRKHRDRASRVLSEHDFLFRESAERLVERLEDIRRSFPLALDLGCHGGEVGKALQGRGGIETLVQCDLSEKMARRAGGLAVAGDEEFLPFAEGAFDLVISNLSLHWVNDLPGALLQIRRVLKPDGLFLGCMLGGDTLFELRRSLMQAELDIQGGAGPRISPFADVRDAGALLQRAGFSLPVVDSDSITVSYGNPLRLLADLRGMGENNAVAERRKGFSRRATIMAAMAKYLEDFGDEQGRVPAGFQLITLTGWSPHESQQKPLRPGSARHSLAEALGTQELPAGEKAPKQD